MDPTRWSRALVSRRLRRALDWLRTSGLILLFMASLPFGPACANRDWIDRTLVTVDVTGTWSGRPEGAQFGRPGEIVLELKQEGSTVTRIVRSATTQGTSSTGPLLGPVKGAVTGDVFRFKDSRGTFEGEVTVSGEEMTGLVSINGTRSITFRRIDPASAPPSPPR